MKVFCTRLLLRKFKEVLWGLVEGGMLRLGGGKGGFGTRRLEDWSALFLFQSILSWHHGILEWEWRTRWWEIIILGSFLIAKAPNLDSNREVASAPQHSETFQSCKVFPFSSWVGRHISNICLLLAAKFLRPPFWDLWKSQTDMGVISTGAKWYVLSNCCSMCPSWCIIRLQWAT